jgi:hypothetical protein
VEVKLIVVAEAIKIAAAISVGLAKKRPCALSWEPVIFIVNPIYRV